MRPVEVPWREPKDMAEAMRNETWAALLDSGGPVTDERSRWSFLCLNPDTTLEMRGNVIFRDGQPAKGDVFTHLREMRRKRCRQVEGLPFSGGIVGLAGYGLGLACEQIVSRHKPSGPDLVAASYPDVMVFDRREKSCFWCSETQRPVPKIPARLQATSDFRIAFTPETDRHAYLASVERIRQAIGSGDIFQANLTMRWHAGMPANFDELTAWARVREAAPAPFGAYLKAPGFALLSASVERFISLNRDIVETRPIKGTAPLGISPTETAEYAATLAKDTKEQAENLMITDLMRNDIGRVCVLGSIRVPQLATVEAFARVQHLVSSVQGKLRAGLDAMDLLQATLPPGSVTGAPKHRAMEIIDEVETSARGAYCGSVFRIGGDGDLDSSVIIRSISRVNDTLEIGAGGGVTWPSDPIREFEETILKAKPLLEALA